MAEENIRTAFLGVLLTMLAVSLGWYAIAAGAALVSLIFGIGIPVTQLAAGLDALPPSKPKRKVNW